MTMESCNPTHRTWLNHKSRLTGPDGTAAVLARRIHPTQEGEEILGASVKSKARGGHVHYAPVRLVELMYELKSQGRSDDIELLLTWLRQQAAEVRSDQPVDLTSLMRREQEVDSRDDPLQLRLAQGDWDVADDLATALYEQAALSRRLANRVEQEDRERRMA